MLSLITDDMNDYDDKILVLFRVFVLLFANFIFVITCFDQLMRISERAKINTLQLKKNAPVALQIPTDLVQSDF